MNKTIWIIIIVTASLCFFSPISYGKTAKLERPRMMVSDSDMKWFKKFKVLGRDMRKEAGKSPERGIKKANEFIGAIEEAAGYKFGSGKSFRMESSLLIDSYDIIIDAYTKMDDCGKATEYYVKLKEVARSEYLIVDPESSVVYDAAVDRDEYFAARQEEIVSLAEGMQYDKKCVDPSELKVFLYSDKEMEYHDVFSVLSSFFEVAIQLKRCENAKIAFNKMIKLPVRKEDAEWLSKYVNPNNVCISKEDFDALSANAGK